MNKSELYYKLNKQILKKLNKSICLWAKELPNNYISIGKYHSIIFLGLSLKDFVS